MRMTWILWVDVRANLEKLFESNTVVCFSQTKRGVLAGYLGLTVTDWNSTRNFLFLQLHVKPCRTSKWINKSGYNCF